MTSLKQVTFQALLARVNELKADVFIAREPGDDEMRRAQGLLSEVRDLMEEAIKKLQPTFEQISPEALKLAAESSAHFCFEGAYEIGTSDVSGCARSVCVALGLDPAQMSGDDFQTVRRAVQAAIREMSL